MAKKSQINKSNRKPKYSTRIVRRCWKCGRNHAVIGDFKLCRICFRELAEQGALPGIKKASW